MLWIALAAQLSAPIPLNPTAWFTYQDVPISSIPDGEYRLVAFQLVVSPDGKVRDCTVTATSRIATLDRLTCDLAKRRGRMKPARGSDGMPAYGVFSSEARWAVDYQGRLAVAADVALAVNHLPEGVRSPAIVRVMFAVDAAGNKSSCSGERSEDNPALVPIACAAVLKDYAAAPVRNDAGAPVASVQDAVVSFVTGR